MARTKRRQARKTWQPMKQGNINPFYKERMWPDGIPDYIERVEVWGNDLYEATVQYLNTGWAYISLKRLDRHAIRDWRHLQSIKNELVGSEREAVELFPAESRLMDESNQYHLWVLPEDTPWPFGQTHRTVLSPDDCREHNREEIERFGQGGKARQRDWQPGLFTGPGAGDD